MTGSAKVMLLGDIGVGKSSLARRLVHDRFESDYKTTLGVDIMTYEIEVGPDSRLKLILWDTDGDFGQHIFETVYMRGASGAVIVSDVSRPSTMVKMANLARGFADQFPGRPACAVVNKMDLVGGDRSLVRGASDISEALYASALTGDGVRTLFATLAAAILRRGV